LKILKFKVSRYEESAREYILLEHVWKLKNQEPPRLSEESLFTLQSRSTLFIAHPRGILGKAFKVFLSRNSY